MAKGFKHVGESERKIVQRMKKQGIGMKAMARILGRDVKTVRRHLAVGKKAVKKGRPVAITAAWYKRLKKALDALLKKAGALKEVKMAMIKRRARCPHSLRAISDAFHARGIYFRPLREKPILTSSDRAKRRKFGGANKHRTKKMWLKVVHLISWSQQ